MTELLLKSNYKSITNLNTVKVIEMNDGGMGSLSFESIKNPKGKPLLLASEIEFNDADGVLVVATLFLNFQHEISELDMWKVDNSKLIQFPTKYN